jgi:hypothetical protein
MAVSISESLEKEIREAAERQGIGIAEFVETAMQAALSEYRERQIATESRTWYALPVGERQKYASVYVAVYRGQVVDTDPDQRALYLRIRQKYGRAPVMITEGGDHPMPVYEIRSPHLVRMNDGD